MRTKLLSFLLIITFLAGSFPAAFADEAVLPVPEEGVTKPVVIPAAVEEPELIVETAEPAPPAKESTTTPVEFKSEPEILDIPEAKTFAPQMFATEEFVFSEATTTAPSISLLIRYGENIAWSGTTTIATNGTITVSPTGSTNAITIPADSLLATLLAVDETSSSFDVTDIDYYSPPLDSFLINCISADVFSEVCGQWQYVVNGTYPSKGVDKYRLSDGDVVYLYFGQPRRVRLEDTDIVVNESFVATAESYDPSDNSYGPFPGHTIGITQPNTWPQVEVATSTSASDGTSAFSVSTPGSYEVSLKMPSDFGEFYDFPPTQFTVNAAATTTDPDSGGIATGFDTAAAYRFLVSGQQPDGSWSTDYVTDWSAIAFGVPGAPSGARSALAAYLREEEPDFRSVTDYERHAMALMALNINPYTGGPSDYIAPIIKEFDGTQIGKPGLVNDDAFALVALLHAGYTKNDDIIRKIAAFIVSKQNGDGSWEGGIDLSGAYIQALSGLSSLPGVSSALTRAEAYMRSEQNNDGGFKDPSDPFVTSWSLQGIEALGGSASGWNVGGNTPLTYLANDQNENGGMDTAAGGYENEAWATAYAIPAAKGLTWDDILHDFRKPGSTGTTTQTVTDSDDTSATTTDDTLLAAIDEPLLPPYVASSTPLAIAPEEHVAAVAAVESPADVSTDEAGQRAGTGGIPPDDLVAGADESGAWEWIEEVLGEFWSFIKNLISFLP